MASPLTNHQQLGLVDDLAGKVAGKSAGEVLTVVAELTFEFGWSAELANLAGVLEAAADLITLGEG